MVGVVSIDYLDDPKPPVSDFLMHLLLNPHLRIDDESDDWSNNSFLEFKKSSLRKRARIWSSEKAIEPKEQKYLMRWLSRLPWKDDYVMLHLGV